MYDDEGYPTIELLPPPPPPPHNPSITFHLLVEFM
jgi:hypothetical protein